MKTFMFDPIDAIAILNFLETFEQARDSNKIQEGTAMWCVKRFMTKSTAASLASCSYSEKKTLDKSGGMQSSRRAVVNHVLETYATENFIAETEMGMHTFKQPSKVTLIE